MTEHEASRTLVKSPPELWAECSDAQSLARHLTGSFGEIRITRLEPEETVAWEGTLASGTVRLEPSGWGTRVNHTARPAQSAAFASERPADAEASAEPAPEPSAEPVPEPPAEPARASEPAPAARTVRHGGLRGLVAGLFRGRPTPAPVAPVPAPSASSAGSSVAPPPAPPSPPARPASPPAPTVEVEAVLGAALDSLGQAHHRPFSRA
jgi:hypothetical protein